ncbi:MAG: acyl-CoA dehydrogenase family protein [Acidimicrobiales bacterium]
MDVRLSPEQRALRDSAVQLVGNLGPRTVGALDDEERSGKLDAAVDAAGWRELRAPSEDAQPWASAVEVAIVAEALAYGAADCPFVGPTLAADLRRRAGAPAAAAPETVGLSADLASIGDGSPTTLAIDAARSTSALVVTAGRLAAVDLAPAEVRTDLTRPVATTATGATATPVADAVIDAGALTAWTALGLAATCADLVGTMRGALELAAGYASDRNQYGRPVGSFQAVQHLLADALVATEGAASATLHAAWAVDALAPEDAVAAGAIAKAWCSRAARLVCETAIQVHGGIGNTWECFAHVHLRRALLSIDVLGGVGPNLDRVLAHHGIGASDGLR